MNYGELQTAVIEDTHRPDLVALVPRFVRMCEGFIRRDLKGYLLTAILTDSDRVSGGVYSVPARMVQIRTIHLQGRQGDALQQVLPAAVRRLDETADVLQFALTGADTIEFRGTLAATDVFDVLYYGTPAPLVASDDTNDLLTDHEGLYVAGTKFYLYNHVQDRELASDELDIFTSILSTLNDQVARELGGNSDAPPYNFSSRSSY